MAIVILAVALTALVQTMTSSLRSSVVANDYLTAAGLVDRMMVEKFVTAGRNDVKSVASTPLNEPYERFQSAMDVSGANEPVFAHLNLKNIAYTVTWPSGKSKREFTAALLTPEVAQP